MNATRGAYIELAGMPGSGKSYLLKQALAMERPGLHTISHKKLIGEQNLERYWQSRGLGWLASSPTRRIAMRRAGKAYHLRSRSAEHRAMLAFSEERPDLVDWILDIAHESSAPPEKRILMLSWFVRLFADYQAVRWDDSNGDKVVLFDESFAQKAFSLVLHLGLPLKRLCEYISRIPKPHAVWAPRTSRELLYQRLERRGWPGWHGPMSTTEKQSFLDRCNAVDIAMKQCWTERGVPVIEFDNRTGRPRALTDQVAKAMARLMESSSKDHQI